ncbi:hypothetical protein ACIQNI_28825 [Streptomyces sp. NPDC091266]|uniref:hypothetical protein n=1 Tax=Streptomyces sp. NPDC091266 TaxID=3365978 RepID=UPI003801790D
MPPSPEEIHQHRLKQLALFIRESDQILTDWDAYCDQHTDLDDLPYDEIGYAQRADLRNADTWRAFNRIRPSAKELVATAEAQLQRLPAKAIQSHWVRRLGALDTALDHLAALQNEWLATRDNLHPSARPGTARYDDAQAERNTDARRYLDEWALAGETILEIHCAARQAPPAQTIATPARTPAPPALASQSTAPRR